MNLFDANTWVGEWPFAIWRGRDGREHLAHLGRHGIDHALVSPTVGVLAPDPMRGNQGLFETVAGLPELEPVPIINPALANWPAQVEHALAEARVRAVRWLPAYHNYRLNEARVAECASALAERGVRLVLTVRLVDERHEFFALRIKPPKNALIAGFLQRHANLRVLLAGLMRPDVVELLPRHAQAFAETSFCEWDRTIERLVAEAPFERIVFGSHTPFHITAAQTAKLSAAELPAVQREAIGRGNLERFLQA